MKRFSWPAVALVAVLGAAFFVQATSTWRLGQRQHLAEVALPALVVLLEVGSITTAAIFFTARSKGLRVRALLLLAVTAGLGGLGGVVAYGYVIGIPVAILMLGLVEVIGAYRRERSTPVEESTATTTVDQEPVDPWVTVPKPEPSTGGDEDVDAHRAPSSLAHLAAGIAWPGPHVEPPVTIHVAGYRPPDFFEEPEPTAPMPRLDDTRAVDPAPETEEQAARRLIAAGRKTERQLLDALQAEGFEATRYRVKKYLGNATRRLEAVG